MLVVEGSLGARSMICRPLVELWGLSEEDGLHMESKSTKTLYVRNAKSLYKHNQCTGSTKLRTSGMSYVDVDVDVGCGCFPIHKFICPLV